MKKIITITLLLMFGASTFAQIDIVKRKVTLDSLDGRSDTIWTSGNIIPQDSAEWDIGSIAKPYNIIYADSIEANYVDGQRYADSSVVFSTTGGLLATDSGNFQYVPTSERFMHFSGGGTGGGTLENFFLGYGAGRLFNGTGYANTVVGRRAGRSLNGNLSTASSNSMFGYEAGYSQTTGSFNSFFGTLSGSQVTTGTFNTFLGYHAGLLATGNHKTAIGNSTLTKSTGADGSVAVGSRALVNATTGINIGIGYQCAENLTTGTRNTIVGTSTALLGGTANDNSFFGHNSAFNGAIGSDNCFFGSNSGRSSTSVGSVYIGKDAAYTHVEGDSNVYIGVNVGRSKTSGSKNILIGQNVTTSTVSAGAELNVGNIITATGVYTTTPVITLKGVVVNGDTVASGNITMGTVTHYSFDGTTATWTLPTLAASDGQTYFIKNRGSGNLTINSSGGGNDIYDTAATNTLTVAAGASITLHNDGTFFVAY